MQNLFSRYVALKDKLYIASALDPRFKALPFLSKETCDNTFSQLVLEAAGLENVDTAIVSYRIKNKKLLFFALLELEYK